MADVTKLPRLDTGIPGLNDILNGGLPPGQTYLLEGEPGTGKTTLAMQFIRAGIHKGERALYITLSEPRAELDLSIRSHDWDPAEIPIVEFTPAEAGAAPQDQYTVFHPSEVELASTIQRLTELIETQRPARLVIDSLSELRLLAADTMRYRRQLLALKQFFSGREITVLLLDDRTNTSDNDAQLRSIAHGVIQMQKIPRSFGVTRRHIEILKLRASAYREGFHDYVIHRGGVVVYPRLVASDHQSMPHTARVPSGITELDEMFGGGIARGSATLILGPTGVGKSTISMHYAYGAAVRGDRAIIYAFDEGIASAKVRARALGMDVETQIERGNLRMVQVDPAELSPGEFSWQIRRDVEEHDTRVVVIDSINGFLNSMPGERDLVLHLHELIAFLNQKGVITFLVITMHGMVGSMQTEVDISYLSDTVVLVRYFEFDGEIRQVISVLKQRLGLHERSLRELSLGKNGIQVGAPLKGFRGVLSGIPETVALRSDDDNHPESRK